MTQRRDYDRQEATVRGAWAASIGANTEEEIRARSRCKPDVAFRIAMLRRGGGLRTLDLWLEGTLGLRQVERIVLTYAFDDDAQLAAARQASPMARALLARTA